MTSTESKLLSLRETALRIPIDDSTKIIMMSDCHRGTGDGSDDFLKNQNLFYAALNHYYDNGFTCIELGDGDELWKNKSEDEIIALHSYAFWLMSQFYKQNRLYIIYGNHDRIKQNSRKFDKYFCEAERQYLSLLDGITFHEGLLLTRPDESTILLAHGHQGDFINDSAWKLGRFLVRYLWRPAELLALKDPTSAAKNYTKKEQVEKRLATFTRKHSQMLIAGHTHRPVFPTGGSLYFNDGSCVHPRCITGIELEHDALTLVKWSVKTKPDGTLFVGRDPLAGPRKLDDILDSVKS